MKQTYECEFLVAGAGIAGICAAIQAGRLGIDTVIIEKEMTLGGNAGPLFGVGPSGAHVNNEFYTETGIVLEIEERLSKEGARPAQNYMALNTSALWDRVISDMLREAGVRIFRKHLVTDAKASHSKIRSVSVTNIENLDQLDFMINGFTMDATGDAHLAYLSGAETVIGRESKSETGERSAPEKSDKTISAASLMAITVDTGIRKTFVPPPGTPTWNPSKPANTFDPNKKYNYIFQVDEGGLENGLNSMTSPQALYESLVEHIYSIWDYFKNTKYKGLAETHELIWISPILGRRESRRIVGDYMLTQTDIEENRDFPDAAGFGGFYLDYHPPSHDGGYETVFYYNPQPYQIPLRCLYSHNIKNLLSGGRAISATHLAFTSTRVMRTGGLLGQSAAVAAYLCLKKQVNPADIVNSYIDEFHTLLKINDVFIPGIISQDSSNLVNSAVISATSEASLSIPSDPISPQYTKSPATARIYSIPDKLDKVMLYVWNKKKTLGSLELVISYGKTSEFIYNEPELNKSPAEYSFHYPERENDVSAFDVIYSKQMKIPAHYHGWVSYDCGISKLEAADRKTVRKCLKIKATGNVDLALNGNPPDFIEGDNIPLFCIEPAYVYGSAHNIKDGVIHREGIGLLHQWISSPNKPLPQALTIDFGQKVAIKHIDIIFDSTEKTEADMFYCKGELASPRLVKSYSVDTISSGSSKTIYETKDNRHRFNKIILAEPVETDSIRITVNSTVTEGNPARIYEVRVI
ncbi:MAG: FAD-dependent oxidoreductase [Clostridia bacterium]|nr:FAD-dependent oxidoreductase [Clostridia bacterium]MBN2883263.1 FAD-dependent oxidoreductase [Clostridia bacterium]